MIKHNPVNAIFVFMALILLSACGGGGSSKKNTPPPEPSPQLNFSANPTVISTGESSQLVWSSSDATTCTASGDWSGDKPLSGNETIANITNNRQFELTCEGAGGNVNELVEVTVSLSDPQPTLQLSANPEVVAAGESSELSWTSNDATSCTASGDWSGNKSVTGSEIINNITSDRSFELTCEGPGGNINETAEVTVSSSPQPTLQLSANPTMVVSGATSQLSWTSTQTDSCTASGDWSGNKGVNGDETVGPLTSSSSFTLSCQGNNQSVEQSVTVQVTPPASSTVFPLQVQNGVRYLMDANGKPFLMHGDTAWSLIAALTESEIDLYLDDRQSRGFNTILVNLIEHNFADNPPNNAYGEGPFLTPGDFSTPNSVYFDYAVEVIEKAADRNMLVLLAPAYLGFGGGGEGWYDDMVNNNALADLESYGAYVANRFQAFDNIVWVNGGDFSPNNLDVVNAVVAGIRSVRTDWLHTFHGARGDSARLVAGAESWLTLNNIYTRADNVSALAATEYNASTVPFFLIEAYYENENGLSTQQLRSQAYTALLSGAKGHLMGNFPMWCFSSGSFCGSGGDWRNALGSNGSLSMQQLWTLFASHEWWRLQPSSMLSNAGQAALADNNFFAFIYTSTNVEVQLNQLSGPNVVATWVNPYTGNSLNAGVFAAAGVQSFNRPASHVSGSDWVLVLESQ